MPTPQLHRRALFAVLWLALLGLCVVPSPFTASSRAAPSTADVTAFGATPNDATNDTAAFMAALSSLAPDGGTLNIPQGVYLITPSTLANPTNITVYVRNNISVIGNGATLKASAIGEDLLLVRGANIAISNLTLDGANKALHGLTILRGSSTISVTDTLIEHFRQPSDPAHPLYNKTPIGIHIAGDGDQMLFERTTVRDIVANNTGGSGWPHKVARGILIDNSDGSAQASKHITIQNSSFSEVGPMDDGDCIVIQSSLSDTTPTNLTIRGNTFDSCHKRAIKIQMPGVTIEDNQISNPFHGNNHLETWGESNTYDMYSAISVYNSDVTVSGNIISGSGSFYVGIDIGTAPNGSNPSNITILNNSVSMGTTANLTGTHAIRTFAPVSGLAIIDNTLDFAGTGITVHARTSLPDVMNNTISHAAVPVGCYPCTVAPVAPSMSRTQNPPPNGFGWNTGDVAVDLTAAGGSGGTQEIHYALNGAQIGTGVLAGATGTVTISAEGLTTLLPYARDTTGTQGSAAVYIFQIDRTAPAITAVRTPANAEGWNNTPITITFTCSDALSGVTTCPGAGAVTTEGAGQSIAGTATDRAGNSAGALVSGINIDLTAPSLTGAPASQPDSSGWYTDAVMVVWSCADTLSGISGVCPASTLLDGEGDNVSATVSASDQAGNSASATVGAIKIDRSAPVTTVSTSDSGSDSVIVHLTAADAVSGVAQTNYRLDNGPQQTGSSVPVSGAEPHTIAFWSADQAGNIEHIKIAQITIDPAHPRATISPEHGGTLATPDNSIQVQFPAGAVTDTVVVRYHERAAPPHQLTDTRRAVRSFALEARAIDGQLITQFERPYTLIISSTTSELAGSGIFAPSLNLAFWNGSAWAEILPCAGCLRDSANNRLVVVLDHFTEYALIGSAERRVFLPMLVR